MVLLRSYTRNSFRFIFYFLLSIKKLMVPLILIDEKQLTPFNKTTTKITSIPIASLTKCNNGNNIYNIRYDPNLMP